MLPRGLPFGVHLVNHATAAQADLWKMQPPIAAYKRIPTVIILRCGEQNVQVKSIYALCTQAGEF